MFKLQDIRTWYRTCRISEQFARGLDGLYGHSIDIISVFFFRPASIRAQRPDATARGSLELWNEKMLRWVNRGARGIALVCETWQNTKLFVMCLTFPGLTHMAAGGRSPYLWQMQEHQREEILMHLEEVYGLEEKDTGQPCRTHWWRSQGRWSVTIWKNIWMDWNMQ